MKGQFGMEQLISLSVFIVFAVYFFFQFLSLRPVYLREVKNERIRSEAYQISELLINDPGYPVNWEDGLVGSWHFDEGSGSSVADSSGNGNTGTLGNASAWTVPIWNTGMFGNALTFNGSEYVNVADANSLDITSFTITAWIRANSTLSKESVLVRKGSNANYNLIFTTGRKVYINFYNGTGWDTTSTSTSTLNLNQWYHVVATFDSSKSLKIYVNGNLESTQTTVGTPASNNNILSIGYYPGIETWTLGFNGTIDEVRIYNRVLSASEIQILYQAKNRIGLSDETQNKTNLLSLNKINAFNSECVGNGYYNVKKWIGAENDFSIFLTDKSTGTLKIGCYNKAIVSKGINVTVRRIVTFGSSYGELILQMW